MVVSKTCNACGYPFDPFCGKNAQPAESEATHTASYKLPSETEALMFAKTSDLQQGFLVSFFGTENLIAKREPWCRDQKCSILAFFSLYVLFIAIPKLVKFYTFLEVFPCERV